MAQSILVLEDAPDLLMLYKRYFANLGAMVVTAESGERGLELIQELKPQVLVMDLTLKDMDTTDFYERFSALEGVEKIKIILISGREDLVTWADLFGAAKSFKKPVERDLITQAVKDSLL